MLAWPSALIDKPLKCLFFTHDDSVDQSTYRYLIPGLYLNQGVPLDLHDFTISLFLSIQLVITVKLADSVCVHIIQVVSVSASL